ncbi:MAG: KEOPS complex subunit Cgi121 [Candidatus Methanosuratincola sp.]
MRVANLGQGQFSLLLMAGLRPRPGADPRPLLSKYSQSPSLQIMDAGFVAGEAHLMTAAVLAKRSWEAGENVSRIPANEVLLFASSRRQIREAIEFMGVRERSSGWVAVAVCENEGQIGSLMQDLLAMGTEDDSLLDLDESRCPDVEGKFGISEEEVMCALPLVGSRVRAVSSLVVERVSISDLYR